MRSIPLNATIASVFGAASAEDTSLPCSNFFRRVCEPTGKETNHKIYKAKTENRRLRNKTAQKWDISDSPKGPKNNGQILYTSIVKKSSLPTGEVSYRFLPCPRVQQKTVHRVVYRYTQAASNNALGAINTTYPPAHLPAPTLRLPPKPSPTK